MSQSASGTLLKAYTFCISMIGTVLSVAECLVFPFQDVVENKDMLLITRLRWWLMVNASCCHDVLLNPCVFT